MYYFVYLLIYFLSVVVNKRCLFLQSFQNADDDELILDDPAHSTSAHSDMNNSQSSDYRPGDRVSLSRTVYYKMLLNRPQRFSLFFFNILSMLAFV